MVKVAISGGTSGIGRAIIHALAGKHEYIVLTRQAAPPASDPLVKNHSVVVDYRDVDDLARTLEQHDVHTVICAISLRPEGAGMAQLNLIRAAEKSKVTKRFIPSEFSVPTNDRVARTLCYHTPKVKAATLLSRTSLEWTRIHSGVMLDYWGLPYYPSFLDRCHAWIDMANDAACIPGSGDVPVVFTHSFDIGEYIAALLSLPECTWPPECAVVGDKVTLNDLVRIAERAKGVSFAVVRDDEERLRAGKVTDLPVHGGSEVSKVLGGREGMHKLLADLGLMVEAGDFDLDDSIALNRRFPDIVTRKAWDVMATWRGR